MNAESPWVEMDVVERDLWTGRRRAAEERLASLASHPHHELRRAALIKLGELRESDERDAEAFALYDQAALLEPNPGWAAACRAFLHWQRGEEKEAERIYREVFLTLDRDDDAAATAIQLYPLILDRTGRKEEAIAVLGRIVQLFPHRPDIRGFYDEISEGKRGAHVEDLETTLGRRNRRRRPKVTRNGPVPAAAG